MWNRARTMGNRRSYRPGLEPIESRTLLSGVGLDPGQYPLASTSTTNSVLVRFKSGANETSVLNSLGAYVAQRRPGGPSTIVLGQGISTSAAVARLNARSDVLYAEENSVIHVEGAPVNDPAYSLQWGLQNTNNVDVDGPESWVPITGGSNVIVAVIDTGIDLNHPEFTGKIWTNTAEVAGNRRDDDRDGYVDDVRGWNFVNRNSNVQDENGHGSHVSGVIAALSNNGTGIAGLNPKATIMPLKFLDASGNGSTDDAVTAIYYAVAHKASVINASWGGGSYSRALHDAIAYAGSKNVLFVTAAGNESANNDKVKNYPATDRLPNLLSIASVDRNGALADFSNYGANTVDVAAPGVDIYSTINGGKYATYSGTSMSTPYVAAIASMVYSLHPTYTSSQVAGIIRGSTKPLPGLKGLLISPGIVSAAKALGLNAGQTIVGPGTASLTDDQARAAIFVSDEFNARTGGTNSGFVTALYQDILGRDPDSAGLSKWTKYLDSGHTQGEVVASFQAMTEAFTTKVARLYQRDLGRTSTLDTLKSDPGVVGWANALRTYGGTDESLEASLVASDEYFKRAGGTNSGFVNALYRDLLARNADASGFSHWLSKLNLGVGRYDLVRQFQSGIEAKEVTVARWFISDLGRGGTIASLKTDPGVVYWASQLII